MTAFTVTTTSVPSGSDKATLYNGLNQAFLNAGFPTPSTYTSGNVTQRGYTVPVPNSSRSATLVTRLDTGVSYTSNNMIQWQMCDSTQYNSSTGVVTGGTGWANTIVWSTNSGSLSTLTTFQAFKSMTGATADSLCNFILVSGLNNILAGLALPTKIATGGDYEWNLTNHTLAGFFSFNPVLSKIQMTLCPGFNPYTALTTTVALAATMYHEDITGVSGDTNRQVIAPTLMKYNGGVPGQGNVFGLLTPDLGHAHSLDASLLSTLNSGKWQFITLSASAGILARIVD